MCRDTWHPAAVSVLGNLSTVCAYNNSDPSLRDLLWFLNATCFPNAHLAPVSPATWSRGSIGGRNDGGSLCANQQHLANFSPPKQRVPGLLSSVRLPVRTALPLLIKEWPRPPLTTGRSRSVNNKAALCSWTCQAESLRASRKLRQRDEGKGSLVVSERRVVWIGSPDGQNVGKRHKIDPKAQCGMGRLASVPMVSGARAPLAGTKVFQYLKWIFKIC